MSATDDIKGEIRQLMMLVSAIRTQDKERYEEHVNFTNEVVNFIKKIQENMNANWDKINHSLTALNNTVEESLDALLTGINPEGLKETSQSLKEIMDTMGKSIQSLNLENVMRELRMLSGEGIKLEVSKPAGSAASSSAAPLKAGLSTPYGGGQAAQAVNAPAAAANAKKEPEAVDGLDEATIKAYKEAYGGVLPPHLQKQVPKKGSHLLKPSDFFGQ